MPTAQKGTSELFAGHVQNESGDTTTREDPFVELVYGLTGAPTPRHWRSPSFSGTCGGTYAAGRVASGENPSALLGLTPVAANRRDGAGFEGRTES